MQRRLVSRIESKEAVIGVLGLGYVGLPLTYEFLRTGYAVIGFDIDESKIEALLQGRSYIKHVDVTLIKKATDEKRFQPTSDMSRVKEVDAIILCVPTPLTKHREPDLSYILDSLEAIIPHMRQGQVLSLESTTFPGTTDEELYPRLAARGWKIGEDVFLVYSPEREDPANVEFTARTIPKIVGGHTPACLEVGRALYGQIIDEIVGVPSTQIAEFAKVLENVFRAVNIALVNELKIVADRMNLDIFEVIRAAATKPFGFMPFYPGPGLGGHCVPIDPFYLTWKAKEFGISTKFIELAGEVNGSITEFVVSKVVSALNTHSKPARGSKILILGIAYKKNVDDMRESPSLVIMEQLQALGADLAYCDPYVPEFPKTREHAFELTSVELTPGNLEKFDCVLLVTNHDCFDWELIRKHGRLIVDTRGVYAPEPGKIFRA